MVDLIEARTALAEYDAAQAAEEAELAALEAQVEAALKRKAELEQRTTVRAKAIKAAKADVVVAQQAEAAEQSASYISDTAKEWSDYYNALGAQFAWWPSIIDYQLHGAKFAASAKRVIIGDEMGLGKTLTTIASLDLMEAKKVVVVCQADICDQFAGEFSLWAPHRNVINLYKKSPTVRAELLDSLWDLEEFVVVINYDILRMNAKREREVLTDLVDQQIDTVVLDEAHNVKDIASSNFKHVSALVFAANSCPRCFALRTEIDDPCPSCKWTKGEPTNQRYDSPLDMMISECSVKNLVMTTGTPILNDPADIFPLLNMANPVQFPTKKGFYQNYCVQNYVTQKWEFREGGLEALSTRIGGSYLARTAKESGIEIPKQHVRVMPIDLDEREYPVQHRVITDLTEAAEIMLESGVSMTVLDTMSLITRKRQANVWAAGIEMKDKDPLSETFGEVVFSVGDDCTESVKMDEMIQHEVAGILKHHRDGKRQVVFSQFKTALAELERRLKALGIRAVRYDGDTPADLRTEIKSNFYAKKAEVPKWDIVLANYKTGGTGLNLTAATVTHVMDEEWNPGKRNQAYARTHRMGQAFETEVYVWRITRSIDTWMAKTIQRKEKIVEGFNAATAADLSNAETDAGTLLEAIKTGEII